MPDLTDEQLAEIDARAAAATEAFNADRPDRAWCSAVATTSIDSAPDVPLLLRALRDARDEIERLRAGNAGLMNMHDQDMAQISATLDVVTRERDSLRERLAAVEKLCDRADREQQPRPGVLGFVASSTLSVTDVRAALAAPTGQPDQTRVDNAPELAGDPVAFLAHRYGLAHTDCWCARCESEAKERLLASGEMDLAAAICGFMHLCPECGNKRCPRAAWHGNDCTGSNEPGQPGSNYPAAPTGQEAEQ